MPFEILPNLATFQIQDVPDEDESGFVITIPVAFCQKTRRQLTYRCWLYPIFASHKQESHTKMEFTFEFAVLSIDEEGEEFISQDGRDARKYIPAAYRDIILMKVIEAAQRLIQTIKPREIYRVTKGIRLPVRAMAKHQRITALFEQLGYITQESGTDKIGRTYWLMVRQNQQD